MTEIVNNKQLIQELRKLFSLLNAKEKKQMYILFLLMVIGSLLEIVGIGTLPAFIAIVARPDIIQGYPVLNNFLNHVGITTTQSMITWGAIALIIVFVVKNAYMSYLQYFRAAILCDMQIRISYDLLERYFNAPHTFHLQRNTLELHAKIFDESRIIIVNVLIPLLIVIMEGIFAISILGLLLALEPVVTLFTFVIFGAAGGGFLRLVRKRSSRLGAELPYIRSHLNTAINEGLSGLKDSRILNRESYFLNVAKTSFDKTFQANKFLQFVNGITKPFVETIAVLAMLTIALLLLAQGRGADAVIPTLTLFGVSAVRLLPSVTQIVACIAGIRYSIFTVDPVYDDFQQLDKVEKIDFQVKQPRMEFKNELELRNLHYTYPVAHRPSVQNLSLSIKRGQAVGFVGSSGAGKTTLVDIILGLLKPQEGSIYVDGKNIFDNIRSWQQNIGYVPQSIYLADSSIMKNIAFGIREDEIDMDKLWVAVKAAQLEDLVKELPEGLDTFIGERGVRLSGGQRQRIGIARALYHNPQVLILDEATSALDNVTERYIVEAIERLRGDRTIITIAHRLSTVKSCDCLYFMKEGNVVEAGTYDELLDKNPDFRKMAV